VADSVQMGLDSVQLERSIHRPVWKVYRTSSMQTPRRIQDKKSAYEPSFGSRYEKKQAWKDGSATGWKKRVEFYLKGTVRGRYWEQKVKCFVQTGTRLMT